MEPVIGRGVGVERPVIDFDEFYRREFASCVVLAVAVTGERQGGEDIAQEAMFDAHRRWERIGAYDSPRGWVRRVVVQRSVKWSRRRTNERRAALRSLTGGHDGDAAEGRPDPDLLAALARLPVQQRASLALHYLGDASVAETADALGVSTGTVKTHLSRGRLRLAELLDGGLADPAGTDAGDVDGRS